MNLNILIDFLVFIFIVILLYRYIKLYFEARKTEYEFTSIVNHTFRTPLTTINWTSDALKKRDLSEDEKLLYIQNLENVTTRLLGIVDLIAGIKDIKNIASYNFEATSLRDILEKTITKYRAEINKKNIAFRVPTFKDIPLLTIDLKKITFVVEALLENAIMYTPKNGSIFIECISSRNKLFLYIGDSGMGLSRRDRSRIFSKFYRSKEAVLAYPDGMGLRLYISKEIVVRHHGKLLAKSKGVNQGTTFILELPFTK